MEEKGGPDIIIAMQKKDKEDLTKDINSFFIEILKEQYLPYLEYLFVVYDMEACGDSEDPIIKNDGINS